MASDKVIIFFAKHNNIGPFIVAKDVIKNIEKITKAIQANSDIAQDKKGALMRFYNILFLLI